MSFLKPPGRTLTKKQVPWSTSMSRWNSWLTYCPFYCLRLLDVKLAPASRAAVALRPVDLETVINRIFNVQLIISNNHFSDPLIDSSVTYWSLYQFTIRSILCDTCAAGNLLALCLELTLIFTHHASLTVKSESRICFHLFHAILTAEIFSLLLQTQKTDSLNRQESQSHNTSLIAGVNRPYFTMVFSLCFSGVDTVSLSHPSGRRLPQRSRYEHYTGSQLIRTTKIRKGNCSL